MQTPVYDGHVFDDNNEQAQYADDKRLVVIFYKRPIKNNVETTKQGRPIFDEKDYIKILTPGSKDTFETEVQDGPNGEECPYKHRFATQWKQYTANQEQSVSGTPLDQVPWLTVGQIAEFKAVNVHTVEGLVGMPDSLSMKFMGHHQVKARAQAFLQAAAGAAPALELQAQLELRDSQIKELQETVAALVAQVKKPEAATLIPGKA